jgi:hypothetical protein
MAKIIDEPIILRYEYDAEGNQIPVYSCKVETTITNTRTGVEYESEDHANNDVADPSTDTTDSEIRRDVNVIAPKLFTGAVIKE